MLYGQRLPMVEDYYVNLGADAPVVAAKPKPPASVWLVVALGLAVPIGGALLGMHFAGPGLLRRVVGGALGFYFVPKIVGPIVGPILKPFADKALADARAAGLKPCTTCG
jgi:hypothetical protein